MIWQFGLAILLIVNVGGIVLSKLASDTVSEKSRGLFWLYLFSACIALLWFAFSGKKIDVTESVFLGIIAIGFINGFANYCNWRALGESMSKTVLFYPLGSVLTIGLAMIFLGEFRLWDGQLIVGAILCFAAIWIFQFPSSRSTQKGKTSKIWLFSVLGMVIIWGLVTFLMQICSLSISRGVFLMGWYIGAFLSTLILLALEKASPLQGISSKIILLYLITAGAIVGALGAFYWTFQLGGPASSVLPIKGLAISIIPIIIGWVYFKERALLKVEWLGFVIGFTGTILILLR